MVLQFDAALFMRAGAIFPEVKEIVPLLNAWQRGFQFHGETARQGAMLMEEIGKAHGFHRLVLFLDTRSPSRPVVGAHTARQRRLCAEALTRMLLGLFRR